MLRNKWFWTGVLVAVMTFWSLASLTYRLWSLGDASYKAAMSSETAALSWEPLIGQYAAVQGENKAWGVVKPDPAVAANAAGKAEDAEKQHKVILKNDRGRQVLCIDDVCYLFLGIDSDTVATYAAFMRRVGAKEGHQAGQNPFEYEPKIVKFERGERIEALLAVDALSLHGVELRRIDTNQTYRIDQLVTDIEKYQKQTEKVGKTTVEKGEVK